MNVVDAVNKRFSNRYFNDETIANEDIELILKAGQKAPNGFGLEAWEFFVVSGDKLQELEKACYGQKHVSTSAFAIVSAAPTTEGVKENMDYYIKDKALANGIPEEKIQGYINAISSKDMGQYFREQTFIATSQMVLQARELDIFSVILGGFDPEAVANVLSVDNRVLSPSLVTVYGKSDIKEKERNNRPLEEIVTYIK